MLTACAAMFACLRLACAVNTLGDGALGGHDQHWLDVATDGLETGPWLDDVTDGGAQDDGFADDNAGRSGDEDVTLQDSDEADASSPPADTAVPDETGPSDECSLGVVLRADYANCVVCVNRECLEQCKTCGESQDCRLMVKCASECTPKDSACFNECWSSHAAGQAAALPFAQDCLAGKCKQDCPNML